MSLEETLRQLLREELERIEARLAERVAARLETLATQPRGDRLLRPEEAAKLTGYSRDTIAKWARTGMLKRYGTARALRVSYQELQDLLAKGVSVAQNDDVETDALSDAAIDALALKRAARG